ncbi:hypothetical protein AA106555_0348 [Neokomagataea thailandica NBRC 106555]|uniref:Uncharacterized protein n=1 Tax=Neokomagataea thailandica NBRC 106555 TaxID=1223520 RepID=A0ABQ0QMX2_9PROT|nr:hypothetical protein AA106555_0348 [Neokomagataea thailandica NBRC 106555]
MDTLLGEMQVAEEVANPHVPGENLIFGNVALNDNDPGVGDRQGSMMPQMPSRPSPSNDYT